MTGNASPAPAALPAAAVAVAPPAAAQPAAPAGGGDLITEDEFEALLDQLHGPAPHAGAPAAAAKPAASGDITEAEFEALLDQLHGPVKHAAAKPAPAPAAVPAAPAPAPKPAKPAAATARPVEAETTVRVDASGWMPSSLGRRAGAFAQSPQDPARASVELHRAVNSLDIATARLQSAVMRTRMQPVSKVFSPLRWRAT